MVCVPFDIEFHKKTFAPRSDNTSSLSLSLSYVDAISRLLATHCGCPYHPKLVKRLLIFQAPKEVWLADFASRGAQVAFLLLLDGGWTNR